jgi:hypothetical protein
MNPAVNVFSVVCCRVSERMLEGLCSCFQGISDNGVSLGCNAWRIWYRRTTNNRPERENMLKKLMIYFFTALISRTVDKARGIMIASSQAKTANNLLSHLKRNENMTDVLDH